MLENKEGGGAESNGHIGIGSWGVGGKIYGEKHINDHRKDKGAENQVGRREPLGLEKRAGNASKSR